MVELLVPSYIVAGMRAGRECCRLKLGDSDEPKVSESSGTTTGAPVAQPSHGCTKVHCWRVLAARFHLAKDRQPCPAHSVLQYVVRVHETFAAYIARQAYLLDIGTGTRTGAGTRTGIGTREAKQGACPLRVDGGSRDVLVC